MGTEGVEKVGEPDRESQLDLVVETDQPQKGSIRRVVHVPMWTPMLQQE